jgi:hypothetical protein
VRRFNTTIFSFRVFISKNDAYGDIPNHISVNGYGLVITPKELLKSEITPSTALLISCTFVV